MERSVEIRKPYFKIICFDIWLRMFHAERGEAKNLSIGAILLDAGVTELIVRNLFLLRNRDKLFDVNSSPHNISFLSCF